MRLTRIAIRGLRGAVESSSVSLDGSLPRLPSGPVGVALSDALRIVRIGTLTEGISAELEALGLVSEASPPDIRLEGGRLIQIGDLCPEGVQAWLGDDADRRIEVELDLLPDPALYGRIRRQAMREPWLVDALGQDGSLSITTSWLFTTDHRVVSIGPPTVHMGETPLRRPGGELDSWLIALLGAMGDRLGHVGTRDALSAAQRLHDASLSPRPARRHAAQRAIDAVSQGPFGLSELTFVRRAGAIGPAFGPALLPLRAVGPAALEALPLVEAVFLEAPDILVVSPQGTRSSWSAPLQAWLTECCEGEDATLEQVVWLPGVDDA